jgi:hypothetical protein
VFLAKLRGANPLWLAAAVGCQLATYVSAAAVWFRVLKRAGSPLPFRSLLRLAFVELFANQAVPTGGLSGSLMVVRGLILRGVASAVAVTALFIAALSYYAAYFMVGSLAFVLLWHSGDLNTAWRALFIAFAIVVATLGMALLLLWRTRGDLIPAAIQHWRPFAQLARMLNQVRADMLRDPRLIFEVVTLQSGIFLLDAATLWCTGRAVGLNVDVGSTFMSFILASVVATLSPVPLGLGSFEGTCTGLLHLMGRPRSEPCRHTYTARSDPLAPHAAGPGDDPPRSNQTRDNQKRRSLDVPCISPAAAAVPGNTHLRNLS